MDGLNLRSVDVLSKEFNTAVKELITRAEKKAQNEVVLASLERMSKRFSLLKSTYEAAPLNMSHKFFIKYSAEILEPDMEKRDSFFMNLDVRAEYLKYSGAIDSKDEFLFNLTDTIRDMYKRASIAEKKAIYKTINGMLQCCIEYKLSI